MGKADEGDASGVIVRSASVSRPRSGDFPRPSLRNGTAVPFDRPFPGFRDGNLFRLPDRDAIEGLRPWAIALGLAGIAALPAATLGPSVALGVLWGGALAALMLGALERWTQVFMAAYRGDRLGLLDRLLLRTGLAFRLLIAGLGIVVIRQSPVPINIWAALIALLLSYKTAVVVAALKRSDSSGD